MVSLVTLFQIRKRWRDESVAVDSFLTYWHGHLVTTQFWQSPCISDHCQLNNTRLWNSLEFPVLRTWLIRTLFCAHCVSELRVTFTWFRLVPFYIAYVFVHGDMDTTRFSEPFLLHCHLDARKCCDIGLKWATLFHCPFQISLKFRHSKIDVDKKA